MEDNLQGLRPSDSASDDAFECPCGLTKLSSRIYGYLQDLGPLNEEKASRLIISQYPAVHQAVTFLHLEGNSWAEDADASPCIAH